MVGETHLPTLLKGLAPELLPGRFVFVSLDHMTADQFEMLRPLGTFRETEGITLILDEGVAQQAELTFDGVYRCITCNIHSSLDAVGMTAAMSAALTARSISANVVAAYYHDHIFVPISDAEDAVTALIGLSQGSTVNE